MSEQQVSAPSEEVLEEMRGHLKAEHGRGFEAKRDVLHEGNPNPDAVISHYPETPASAEGFWCAICERRYLSAMEPPLSEERIVYLARGDPELERLLAEVDEDERAELVEAHRASQTAAALLAQRRRKERLRTVKPQPAAAARRQAANAFMLRAYEELGTEPKAIWALLDLRRTDPDRYRKIMGTDRLYAEGTLEKYWREEVPLEVRQAAKQRFLDRQAKS